MRSAEIGRGEKGHVCIRVIAWKWPGIKNKGRLLLYSSSISMLYLLRHGAAQAMTLGSLNSEHLPNPS